MYFLYPSLLWGLLAALIPLLLHLFSFQRAKRLPFSQVPLLTRLVRKSLPRHRIRRWVLLALRMLAIIALVLAFAQPYLPPQRQAPLSTEVVLYLDNSASMTNLSKGHEGSSTVLEEAIRLAQGVVKAYPAHTRFRLFTHSAPTPDTTPRSAKPTLEALSSLEVGAAPKHPAQTILYRILRRLKDSQKPMDVYWFSDFQRTAYQKGAHLGRLNAVDSLHHWQLIPLSWADSANLYIDSLWLKRPFLAPKSPNSIHMRIRNDGPAPIKGAPIRFLINKQQMALQTAHIPPFGQTYLQFPYTPDSMRYQRGEFHIQDTHAPFDNTRYVVLAQSPPLKMVEIYGKTATKHIQQAYADNERFRLTRRTLQTWDAKELYDADLVLLNHIQRLTPTLEQNLSHLLKQGKALWVIPHARLAISSYQGLLPSLEALSTSVADSMSFLRGLKRHAPFFSDVFERFDQPNMLWPQAKALYDWHPTDKETLIAFDHQRAFLSLSHPYPNARLYFVASPIQAAYTNLMTRPLFIPLVYKIALYGHINTDKLYYNTQQNQLSFKLSHTAADASPEQPLALRYQNRLYRPKHKRIGDRYTLFWTAHAPMPGFHEVLHPTQKKTRKLIAFNLPSGESRLNALNEREIMGFFSGIKHKTCLLLRQKSDPHALLSDLLSTRYLWRELLWIALVFLILEMLVLRYFWAHRATKSP